MNNKIRETILSNRLVLNEKPNLTLQKYITEEFDLAKKKFEIKDEQVQLFFCYTINKHTSLETLYIHKEMLFLVVDIHQMEVFYPMVINYFFYGQPSYKSVFLELLYQLYDAFDKKINSTVLLLQAEKELLHGNVLNAERIIQMIPENQPFLDESKCGIDVLYFVLKDISTAKLIRIIYRIYIFHEMAHVKFKYSSNIHQKYIDDVQSICNLIIQESWNAIPEIKSLLDKIPYEDCSCDAYVLEKIIKDNIGPEITSYLDLIINAYIAFVTNMEMMESIRLLSDEEELEEYYIISWLRIMLSIYTVEKNIFADNPDIFEYLHNMMRHYLHVFEQYRRKFYRTWIEMKEKSFR